jgi:hypothetical protein
MRQRNCPSGVDPSDVVKPMLGRIPSSSGQIQPADEGDGIIDHNDFRMMRGAQRVVAVHMEMHARMPSPTRTKKRKRFALERENHREIPDQDMDLQIRPPHCQIVEIASQIRKTFSFTVGKLQMNTAIEVPAPDEDRIMSELESVGHRRKISCSIDQKFDPRCLGELPTITTFLEDSHQSKSNKAKRKYHMDCGETVNKRAAIRTFAK